MIVRAVRRRRMMRKLRQLDRIDARYGLGAPAAQPPRRIGARISTLITLVITVTVLIAFVVFGGVLPQSFASHLGLGKSRLAEPPASPVSTSYRFMNQQPGGAEPVAWDPCRPIQYAINPAGGPPHATRLVRGAIAEVSRLTGLVFERTGVTTDRPQQGTSHSWLPRTMPYDVLVSWAGASEVPKLSGPVAGIGGSAAVSTDTERQRYAHGEATLDTDAFHKLQGRPHGRALERAILLHELGHVVGLGHVGDPAQLMYADNQGLLDFSDGDRAGLVQVGSGRCF